MGKGYQANGPVYANGQPVPPEVVAAQQQQYNVYQQQQQQPYVAAPCKLSSSHPDAPPPGEQPYYQQTPARAAYQPQAAPPLTTVIVSNMGGDGCRSCNGPLVRERRINPMQIFGCICLFLVFWPICWIPFVIDSCYDQVLVCSNCNRVNRRYGSRDY